MGKAWSDLHSPLLSRMEPAGVIYCDLILAFSDVYSFGPTFRAENSNTSRHLAEFCTIEPEMAFCDLQGDMDLAEAFLKYIFKYVLENCVEDMDFFNKRIDKSVLETADNILNNEFERITYTEAITILENTDKKFEYPVSWGLDLQSEHERYLAEEYFKKPLIVADYPKEIKAFYMRFKLVLLVCIQRGYQLEAFGCILSR